jgi:hypothetical protein
MPPETEIENKALLPQFCKYIREHSTEEEYKALMKNYDFKTEDSFENFVFKCLDFVVEKCSDPNKNELNLLEAFKDKLLLCLSQAGKEEKYYNELQEILKLKNNSNISVFKERLKLFFKKLLKEKTQDESNILKDLWEEYFKGQSVANVFSDRTKQIFEGFIAQNQADPLKRAGMLVFEFVFTVLDFAKYENTHGKQKLSSYRDEESKEENLVHKHWRAQRGVATPS